MTTDYWKRDLGTTLRPITNLYSKDVRYEGYINVTQDNNTLKLNTGNGADYVLPVGQYTIASLMKAVETVFVDLGIVGLTVTQSPLDHKITIDYSGSGFTVGYEYGTVNRLLGFNTSITTPVTTLTGDIPVDTNRFLSDLDKSVIALDPPSNPTTTTTYEPKILMEVNGSLTLNTHITTTASSSIYTVTNNGKLITYQFTIFFEKNATEYKPDLLISIPGFDGIYVPSFAASVTIGHCDGISFTNQLLARITVGKMYIRMYNVANGSLGNVTTPIFTDQVHSSNNCTISGTVTYHVD